MLAYVFPGQGSQKRGMGQPLFDSVAAFAAVEQEVDKLLGYSVRELCLENRGDRLSDTRYTQPSLYIVNALHFYDRIGKAKPDYVAGHSLGEYNALLAAGVFDFMTGLRLVQKRGELMSRVAGGGMAAVIGLQPERILETLAAHGVTALDIANYNSPSQVVISGPADAIERAAPILQRAGVKAYLRLPVSAAFHSRYMEEMAAEFEQFVLPLKFSMPTTTVLSNVTGAAYPIEHSTAIMKYLLIRQISQPVKWTDTISTLLASGVTTFEEVGPGNVLTGLIRQIREHITVNPSRA